MFADPDVNLKRKHPAIRHMEIKSTFSSFLFFSFFFLHCNIIIIVTIESISPTNSHYHNAKKDISNFTICFALLS